MSSLDPCPFCGDENSLLVTENELGWPVVFCKKCECEGPPSMDLATKDDAVEKWNTRAFTRSVLEKFVAETYEANRHLETEKRAPK